MRLPALLATLLLAGCCTAGDAWNAAHRAWLHDTYPTAQTLDVTMPVRVRGWGSQEAMRLAAVGRFGKAAPGLGGLCVSSDPIEVWTLIREDGAGRIVLPWHILGHEAAHAVRLGDGRVRDADEP